MTRWTMTAALLLGVGSLAGADGPAKDLTPAEQKALEAKIAALDKDGTELYQAGKLPEAVQRLEALVDLLRTLYPRSKFPDGHAELAVGLNNLASVLQTQGRPVEAEPLLREALAMR